MTSSSPCAGFLGHQCRSLILLAVGLVVTPISPVPLYTGWALVSLTGAIHLTTKQTEVDEEFCSRAGNPGKYKSPGTVSTTLPMES